MPATINRMDLLGKLERMRAGVSNKPVLEQSSSVVFKNGMLITYNDEVSCRMPSGVAKDFTCAVLFRPLVDILNKMQEEELTVELTDSEMVVHGKNRKTGIFMEKEIHLAYSTVEKPEEWKPLPEDFAEAVSIVAAVAGKDESRFAATCINLTKDHVEATDNMQIIRYKIATGFAKSSMIRKEGAKVLGMLEVTHFAETKAWVHFRAGKFVYSVKRYMEEYLDLAQFLKPEGHDVQLPKSLSEAADRAQVFSSENADENLVTIKIDPGRVLIEGRGSSGWYKEVKKADYQGPPLHFLMSPTILSDVLKKLNRCQIADGRLMVNGGKWKYTTVLTMPEGR